MEYLILFLLPCFVFVIASDIKPLSKSDFKKILSLMREVLEPYINRVIPCGDAARISSISISISKDDLLIQLISR